MGCWRHRERDGAVPERGRTRRVRAIRVEPEAVSSLSFHQYFLTWSQFRGVGIPGKDIASRGRTEGVGRGKRERSFAIVGHHKDRMHGRRIVQACGCCWRSIVGRHGFHLGSRGGCVNMANLLLILWIDSLFGWDLWSRWTAK